MPIQPIELPPQAACSQLLDEAEATILCVDDEPDMLVILDSFLKSEGFEVITACSGPEALSQAKERLPDLIVTDYTMPGMTGIELCSLLRSSCETRSIPIILHTAQSVPADLRLYDRTFIKPADLDAFVVQIRVLLRI